MFISHSPDRRMPVSHSPDRPTLVRHLADRLTFVCAGARLLSPIPNV